MDSGNRYYLNKDARVAMPNLMTFVSGKVRSDFKTSESMALINKVVKPCKGPSAVLVLNGTGHNVVQDFGLLVAATGYNRILAR